MEHSSKDNCPSCGSDKHNHFLTVKDHFLTKEDFSLLRCGECDFLFTSPRPSLDKIGDYYKSEDYVSHSSTKKGIVNRVYNVVRNYTLNKKIKLVETLVSDKKLLDIGAGTGHFLARAASSGFDVSGLEPDPDARRVAKELNGVDLRELSGLYELNPESFDAITMWHVLEHVYDLNKDLTQITSLLKKNGVLIIAVPNHTSFDAEYYKEFWAAYDVPRHLYHFSPDTIKTIVEKTGLKFAKMLPMKFDSYYVSMLSEKYRGGGIVNAMRIGWLSNWKAKNGKYSSQIYIFRK